MDYGLWPKTLYYKSKAFVEEDLDELQVSAVNGKIKRFEVWDCERFQMLLGIDNRIDLESFFNSILHCFAQKLVFSTIYEILSVAQTYKVPKHLRLLESYVVVEYNRTRTYSCNQGCVMFRYVPTPFLFQ